MTELNIKMKDYDDYRPGADKTNILYNIIQASIQLTGESD